MLFVLFHWHHVRRMHSKDPDMVCSRPAGTWVHFHPLSFEFRQNMHHCSLWPLKNNNSPSDSTVSSGSFISFSRGQCDQQPSSIHFGLWLVSRLDEKSNPVSDVLSFTASRPLRYGWGLWITIPVAGTCVWTIFGLIRISTISYTVPRTDKPIISLALTNFLSVLGNLTVYQSFPRRVIDRTLKFSYHMGHAP